MYQLYKNLGYDELNMELLTACDCYDLKTIRYLLNSPKLKIKPNVHYDDETIFRSLFYSINFNPICSLIFEFNIDKTDYINNLISKEHSLAHQNKFAAQVKRLFRIRDINVKSNNHVKNINDPSLISDLNDSLVYACHSGNLEFVKYFLTSKELIMHANVHGRNNLINDSTFDIIKNNFPNLILGEAKSISRPLATAFLKNHLDIVDFLMHSPDLQEHANIHEASYEIFKYGIRDNNIKAISSLIVDYNIEKNEEIANLIESYKKSEQHAQTISEIERMFRIIDLNKDLQQNLPISNDKNNKPKI